MNKAVTWRRALSLTLLVGATSFIPAPVAWASASSSCPEGQEQQKSGRCEAPCPRGQLRHPAGYCTCGVPIGDPGAFPTCVEAVTALLAPGARTDGPL
jgi:hypothetical protein